MSPQRSNWRASRSAMCRCCAVSCCTRRRTIRAGWPNCWRTYRRYVSVAPTRLNCVRVCAWGLCVCVCVWVRRCVCVCAPDKSSRARALATLDLDANRLTLVGRRRSIAIAYFNQVFAVVVVLVAVAVAVCACVRVLVFGLRPPFVICILRRWHRHTYFARITPRMCEALRNCEWGT